MIFLSGNSSVSQHQAFEKYYLTINKKAVFIGDLFPHDDETLVNHKVIPPGFGKFKIKTVFAGRHDAVHLSSKQKKRRDCGLNYSP